MDETESSEFLKTDYAKQLLADSDETERERKKFNKKWNQFLERNADDLGAILIAHLSVEYYLDDWLAAANPSIKHPGEARLSFAQKLDLAEGPDGLILWLMPAMRQLNTIRNRLAHNMQARITEEQLKPFRDLVWPWRKSTGGPLHEGVELIMDSSLMVSGSLAIHAGSIRRYGKGCGLVAYRRWAEEALRMKHP